MKKVKRAGKELEKNEQEIKISRLSYSDNGRYLCEYPNGDKVYYLDDQFHRDDGPAIEFANGNKYWYLFGKYIPCTTQEEFAKFVKITVF